MTDEPEKEPVPTPPEPVGEPTNPIPTIVDQANSAADRIEKATKLMESQLQRMEVAAVEKRLGGSADVSSPAPVETDADYAEKALKGEVDGKA